MAEKFSIEKDHVNIAAVLDVLKNFSPNSFDEYNAAAGAFIEGISDTYGFKKVSYCLLSPKFESYLPGKTVLFDNGRADEKPVCFDFNFLKDGLVSFEVYAEKGKNFEDKIHDIEIIFRQLFYILNLLTLRAFGQVLTEKDISTGIDNLNSFIAFCGKLIAAGRIENYTAFFFNIHNFKAIHRSLTYLEGNAVMKEYAQTVANSVTRQELVARLGGDNYVAIVLTSNKDSFIDLISNMTVNFKKNGLAVSFFFGATIGASELVNVRDPGEVMMRISSAYQSAREKRAAVSYYDREISNRMVEQKVILSRFPGAIAKREFCTVYQPKVGVKSRRLLGAEALVRWKYDDEFILPGKFIPVFENDGCICALDFYVLEDVCRLQRKLLEQNIEPVKISVNFSKRHLSDNKLVDNIVNMVDKYGVPRQYIEVELTESEDYHNQGVMKKVVDDLNTHGIKTSIDDFGTGYSSLEMLRTLSLDTLKIDKSFIPKNDRDIADSRNTIMLKGVVGLAKSLGLTIVAEGVETPSQLELIKSVGCDIVQGYIFDKPLFEKEFIERLIQKDYEK